MTAIADPLAPDGLWSWCIAGRVEPARVRAALAEVLDAQVGTLEAPAGVLCDVWHVGGDFPTLVDCFLAPAGYAETTVASAVAGRLGAVCLLPDDTLNPTRYVLAEPNGTLRAVHVDETETDDGPERRHPRPCTGADPSCVAWPGCGTSRWTPQRPAPEREAQDREAQDREAPGHQEQGGRAADAA